MESEREVRETETTREQQQLEFKDTIGEDDGEFSGDSTRVMYKYPLPYESFDMRGTLDRAYLVRTVQFTASATANQLLATVNFPDDLFQSVFLRSKLDGFHFFQADGFSVEFRLNSTQFNAGMLVAAYRPIPTMSDRELPTSAADMCGWPHCLISASSEDVTKLTIPWIYPNPAYDLNKGLEDFDNQVLNGTQFALGQVQLRVLLPLISATASPPGDVTVSVWANFENPICYLPDPADAITYSGYRMLREKGLNVDVPMKSRGTRYKNEVYLCRLTLDKFGDTVGQLKWEEYEASRVVDPAGARDALLRELGVLGEAQSLATLGTIAENVGTSLATTAATEAITSAVSGEEKVKSASSGKHKRSFLEKIPIVGGIVTAGKNILHGLGLQKPTDVSTTSKRILQFDGNMSRSVGVDPAVRLMPDVHGYVATHPEFAGSSRDENALVDMAMTPSIVDIWEFDSVTTTNSLELSPSIDYVENGGFYRTILSGTARMFHLWRGSLKVMLYIVSAKNVSGRFKLTFNTSDSATSTGLSKYDMYSQIIDFKGDTIHKVVFPFASAKPHLEFTDSIGVMDLDLITNINAPGATDFKVRVLVFIAAAEDIDFRLPVSSFLFGNNAVAEIHTRTEFLEKDDWKPIHRSATMSKIEGISNPDAMKSLKDVLGYYQPIFSRATQGTDFTVRYSDIGYWPLQSGVSSLLSADGNTANAYTMMQHLKNMFYVWRGSSRYKVVATPSNGMVNAVNLSVVKFKDFSGRSVTADGLKQESGPVTLWETSYRSMHDVEVPYITPANFVPVSTDSDSRIQYSDITTSVMPVVNVSVTAPRIQTDSGRMVNRNYVMVFGAVGDDFRFGFLHSPGLVAIGSRTGLRLGSPDGLMVTQPTLPILP